MQKFDVVPLEKGINLEQLGRPVPENHEFFDTPFTMIMLGPKRSGKTSLTANFLKKKELYHQYFRKIAVFCPNIDLYQDLLADTSFLFTSYDDQKLMSIIDMARDIFHDDEDPGETLLILDDAMGEKVLKSPLFTQLMSLHRNIGLSIIMCIQDIICIDTRIRNLFDHLILWRPNKSDVRSIFHQIKRVPEYSEEFLMALFMNPNIFVDRHDFVSFNLIKKKILKNLQHEIVLRK